MEHFYLIANPSKKGSAQVARQIAEYLQAHGAVCEGSAQEKRREGAAYGYTDKRCIPKETQCVITLDRKSTRLNSSH